ncbi:hypothetical protein J4E89_010591 [Alternaria sp. Ai002NY15]|nr:hypothetical protein J4E89_010591 [Alternaria sp. Ai002NY15]
MKLPDRSLEKLVKTYTKEGHDPHIAFEELTEQQQMVIYHSFSDDAELVYVNVKQNITVSSVFGVLNIDTLKWVLESRSPLPTVNFRGYDGPRVRSPLDPVQIVLSPALRYDALAYVGSTFDPTANGAPSSTPPMVVFSDSMLENEMEETRRLAGLGIRDERPHAIELIETESHDSSAVIAPKSLRLDGG